MIRVAETAMLMPEGVTPTVLALLLCAALAAGFVDAVVGGGGLLQLPALLLVPGMTPVQALATNKLASVFGTAVSSVTYYRRVRPSLREISPIAAIAGAAAIGGASLASSLPVHLFKPIIVVALATVALITLLKPQFGVVVGARKGVVQSAAGALGVGLAVGAAIGFYDGLLGPGTGTFLIFALVGLLGHDFLHASAGAKIVNLATNLGALILFVPHGAVLWALGLLMAAANIAGSYVGSRVAIAKGARFVRAVFLAVVFALIVKLGFDVWSGR